MLSTCTILHAHRDVDAIFAAVAEPDQTSIAALHTHTFLQNEGHSLIFIKVNCIYSTAWGGAVFKSGVKKLQQKNMKLQELLSFERYHGDRSMIVGVNRPPPR